MVDALLTLVSVAVAGLAGYRMWQRAMQERAGSVKAVEAVVVSSPPALPPPVPASSLQTDGPQTPDRPMIAKPTPEQILDIFKVARAAGIRRETLAGPWRAAGLPFDNNLWAQAAPPEPAEDYVTPIAGRPTKRGYFQDEPALAYQPPPQPSAK